MRVSPHFAGILKSRYTVHESDTALDALWNRSLRHLNEEPNVQLIQ